MLKPNTAALIAREHNVNANPPFKWRRHYPAVEFDMPEVALREPAAVNWLPVAVAATASDASVYSPDSAYEYESDRGEVRVRLSSDNSIATLVKIVPGLA
jgi:transposase-like protein